MFKNNDEMKQITHHLIYIDNIYWGNIEAINKNLSECRRNLLLRNTFNSDNGCYELLKMNEDAKPITFFGKNYSKLEKKVVPESHCNYYISQEKFRSWHATNNNILGLTNCFLDLDTFKNNVYGFNWKKLCKYLKKNINIEPTVVVFSGHGYYLTFQFPEQITIYNKISLNNTIISKWKHVEHQLAKYVNKFSNTYYGHNIVDKQSITPCKLLRCSNSINYKYLQMNNAYTQPVQVTVLMVKPSNEMSLRDMAENLCPGHVDDGIKRYRYVQVHKKYYKEKTKRINYIKNKKHLQRYVQNTYSRKKRNQLPYPKAISKASMHKYCMLREANVRRLQGFIAHIQAPNYTLSGHIEMAMFIYGCLYALKFVIQYHDFKDELMKFTDNILAPKLINENNLNAQELAHDEDYMTNKIVNEVHHFRKPEYMTKLKKNILKYHPYAQFYIPSSDWIMAKMAFNGIKLYITKKDKRIKKRNCKRQRNYRISDYYFNRHWTKSKIAKKFKLSRHSINKILNI